MADSAAWTLSGIAPPDNTYRDAGDDTHRSFWRFISQRGVERFRWRCSAGLDRNGAGLAPISARTRQRGRWRSHTGQGTPDNPPLSPALGKSRTPDLIRGRGFPDHAEWHWGFDEVSGRNWGQVMLWHRAGAGHLPQRDVIGWSADDLAWLRTEGAKWWYAYQHGQRVAAAGAELGLPTEHREAFHPEPPKKIKVVGRTDIEYATFGIGGNRERTARAIEEGYHTGFRQLPAKAASRTAAARPGPKPKTVPWVHPARVVPGKPGRVPAPKPAAVARPLVNPYDTMPAINPLAHERMPLPAPPPDLATFAARAKAAAAAVAAEGRVGRKVLISHAHAAYVRLHGPILLAEFKALLGRAVHARHLDLSRADLVEALDILDVRASHTLHPSGGAEFHFIHAE